MCDMGEDETVEHVILECAKYVNERNIMMNEVMIEIGCEENELMEKTGSEWMSLLLGLYGGETNVRIIKVVKEFLEKMWYERNRQ